MRVYTSKKSIVNIKHFHFCTKDYTTLLALQNDHPNLALEVDNGDAFSTYIRINQIDLENRLELMALNAHEAAVSK